MSQTQKYGGRGGYEKHKSWNGGDRYKHYGAGGLSGGGRLERSSRRGNQFGGGGDSQMDWHYGVDRARDQDQQGEKRKRSSTSCQGPAMKKLKPGNNWHGKDRHTLMQPKAMESRPENFEQDWTFVICPPGKRRTVVAANNVTQSYNNAEDPDMKFESCLPSGNNTKDEMFKQQDLTVLDAIYHPEKKSFFIIDMMHWRHYPYYETEAEFRYFCLQDKWKQLKMPELITDLNDCPLIMLRRNSCSDKEIQEALKNFGQRVDFIMFIKKTSLYLPSNMSDCLRLRIDKLEEVLGIPIPEGVEFVSKDSKKRDDSKCQVKERKVDGQDENFLKLEMKRGQHDEDNFDNGDRGTTENKEDNVRTDWDNDNQGEEDRHAVTEKKMHE